jgi:hypothetical protein
MLGILMHPFLLLLGGFDHIMDDAPACSSTKRHRAKELANMLAVNKNVDKVVFDEYTS